MMYSETSNRKSNQITAPNRRQAFQFGCAGLGGRDIGWAFDNVRITFVPEPSTYALLILGLAVFAPRRFCVRRRGDDDNDVG
jgi:hypothetical protein